jgi:DNA-binding SARP family transcriptional activator
MPLTLHLCLLGDFSLIYDKKPVTGLTFARVHSLLAYLVLYRRTPQSR